MTVNFKALKEIEDFEDFSKYAIDTEGNLWSLKYKQPKLRKPIWTGRGTSSYLACRVRNDYGKPKTLYIHRLVALAFLPCYDPTYRVSHKNGNRTDNRLGNLEWMPIKRERKKALNYILHESLVQRILQVHVAAQKKGLRVGDSYSFTTTMVENAIDSYVMQYGLRRLMVES
jgi:hypothetical protein